jgi:hypothetical protein
MSSTFFFKALAVILLFFDEVKKHDFQKCA